MSGHHLVAAGGSFEAVLMIQTQRIDISRALLLQTFEGLLLFLYEGQLKNVYHMVYGQCVNPFRAFCMLGLHDNNIIHLVRKKKHSTRLREIFGHAILVRPRDTLSLVSGILINGLIFFKAFHLKSVKHPGHV